MFIEKALHVSEDTCRAFFVAAQGFRRLCAVLQKMPAPSSLRKMSTMRTGTT